MAVVVFGSINLDLIFALPHIPAPGETVLGPSTRIEPGGKGANQAVAAARDGAAVVMAGAVGRDALADGALRLLREAGVDLTRVGAVEASTGCAAIAVDPGGENAICVGSGANLLATAKQVEDAMLRPSNTLVLQLEVPAGETARLVERARGAGMRIVLNLAPAAALPEATLRAVDVLLVNANEGAWLAGHLGCNAGASALSARLGGVAVVWTRGGDGADVADGGVGADGEVARAGDGRSRRSIRRRRGIVSPVFWRHRLDRGKETLRQAVDRASAAAALCCTRAGSQSSLPLAVATQAFIQRSM